LKEVAAPDAGQDCSHELRKLNFTLSCHRLVWRDGWWKPSFPPRAGCMVVLEKGLAHLGDVVLHEMLVQRVNDLQSTDKRKCKYILITVGDLCEMILGKVDI